MTSLNEIANAGIKDLAKDSLDWLNELCPALDGLVPENIIEKGTKLAESDQEGIIKLDHIYSVVIAYDFRRFLEKIVETEEDLLNGGLDKINSGPSVESAIGIIFGATVLTSLPSKDYSSQIMPFLNVLNASLPKELLPSTELDAWCAAKLSSLATNQPIGTIDEVFKQLGYTSEFRLLSNTGLHFIGEGKIMLGDDVVRAFNNFYNPEIPASSMINTIGNIFKVISALSGQTRELEEKFTSLPDYKKAISEISKSYNMPVVEIESLPFYERMLIFVSHNIEEHTTVDLSNIKEFVYSNGVFALGLEFLNNAYNLNERGTFAIEGLPYRSNDMNLWSRSKGFTRRSSTENIYNALALDKGCEIDLFKSGPNSDLLEAGMEQVEEAITTVDQAYTPLYRLISNAGLFLHMFENRSYKKRLNRISIGAGYVLTRNHEINEEVRSSNEFLTQLNDYVVNSSK